VRILPGRAHKGKESACTGHPHSEHHKGWGTYKERRENEDVKRKDVRSQAGSDGGAPCSHHIADGAGETTAGPDPQKEEGRGVKTSPTCVRPPKNLRETKTVMRNPGTKK